LIQRNSPLSTSSWPSRAVTKRSPPNISSSAASMGRRGVGEVEARPAAVAVAGDREVREQAGLQAVSDGVEHRDVGDPAVQGVVEGVAAHVVRRCQQAADDDPVGAEGERRQQAVLHLGGQGHRRPAAGTTRSGRCRRCC
jgi:hypothetical protein